MFQWLFGVLKESLPDAGRRNASYENKREQRNRKGCAGGDALCGKNHEALKGLLLGPNVNIRFRQISRIGYKSAAPRRPASSRPERSRLSA